MFIAKSSSSSKVIKNGKIINESNSHYCNVKNKKIKFEYNKNGKNIKVFINKIKDKNIKDKIEYNVDIEINGSVKSKIMDFANVKKLLQKLSSMCNDNYNNKKIMQSNLAKVNCLIS